MVFPASICLGREVCSESSRRPFSSKNRIAPLLLSACIRILAVESSTRDFPARAVHETGPVGRQFHHPYEVSGVLPLTNRTRITASCTGVRRRKPPRLIRSSRVCVRFISRIEKSADPDSFFGSRMLPAGIEPKGWGDGLTGRSFLLLRADPGISWGMSSFFGVPGAVPASGGRAPLSFVDSGR